MMNYEYFKTKVVTCLGNYIPEQYKDYEVKSIPYKKINEIRDAIILVKPNPGKPNISAVVYLDDLYELYRYSNDLVMILEYTATFLTECINNIPMPKIELDNVTDNVIFQLVNTLRNEELLKRVPSRKYNDLSVVYRWIIGRGEDGEIQSSIITNELADIIGVSEAELFKMAMKNTVELFPPVIRPILNILEQFKIECIINNRAVEAEIEQILAEKNNVQDENNFWVLTNEDAFCAAGLILHEDILWSIANQLDSDLYILPSSVHEILIAKTTQFSLEDLVKTVREVNAGDTVRENEFLSNHIYYYDRIQRKVYIAA